MKILWVVWLILSAWFNLLCNRSKPVFKSSIIIPSDSKECQKGDKYLVTFISDQTLVTYALCTNARAVQFGFSKLRELSSRTGGAISIYLFCCSRVRREIVWCIHYDIGRVPDTRHWLATAGGPSLGWPWSACQPALENIVLLLLSSVNLF